MANIRDVGGLKDLPGYSRPPSRVSDLPGFREGVMKVKRVTQKVINFIDHLESEVVEICQGTKGVKAYIESVGDLMVMDDRLLILTGDQYRTFKGKPGMEQNATRQQYLALFHHAEEVRSAFQRARVMMELDQMAVGEERHFRRQINDGDTNQYLTVCRCESGYLLFFWRWDPGEVELGYYKVTAHHYIPVLSLSEVVDRLGPSAVLLSQKELESALGGFMIPEIEFDPENSGMGLI